MRAVLSLFIWVMVSSPQIVFSAESAATAAVRLNKLAHQNDPYSFMFQFTTQSKRFSGQIIETDRFRPPVLLKQTKDELTFANYFHQGKYWIARINLNSKIEKTYFHVVKFAAVPGVTAAHTQYRIVFAPGSEVELTSQINGESEVAKVNDIVISYEASRPQNIPYSFLDGVEDNYAIVARALSGAQRADESTETPTEQYQLKLNDQESIELLTTSIVKGSKDQFTRFYNTLSPNCTTEVFTRIDELSTRKHLSYQKFLTVLSVDPIAGPSLRDLNERRILGLRGPNLESEIYKGEFTYIPTQEGLIPKMGIFPDRLANQWSLVFYIKNEQKLTQTHQKIIKEIEKDLYGLVGQILQTALSSSSLGESEAQQLFQRGLIRANTEIHQFLTRLDQRLPADFSEQILLYFVPFVGSPQDEVTQQIVQGLPARLPFKTYRATEGDLHQIRSAPKKVRFAFDEETKRKNLDVNPAHFVGAAMSLNLKRSESLFKIQIIGGLNPITKDLGIEQGPVRLDSINATSKHGLDNQSLMLMEMTTQVGIKNPPQVIVNFGQDLGASTSHNRVANMTLKKESKDFGMFSVNEGRNPSFERLSAVPYFLGEENYFGINLKFPILSMDIDLETLSLSQINLRVFKPSFGISIGAKTIDEQFRSGINAKINDFRNQLLSKKGNLLQQIFEDKKCNSMLKQ